MRHEPGSPIGKARLAGLLDRPIVDAGLRRYESCSVRLRQGVRTTSVVEFLQTYGQDIRISLTTLFGSCGMYIFSSYKGFDNSTNFLRKMLPAKTETFYYRCDFLLMSLAGALIGLITFSPQGIYQALAAGFGWTGAMNVLLKTEPPRPP